MPCDNKDINRCHWCDDYNMCKAYGELPDIQENEPAVYLSFEEDEFEDQK